MAALSLNQVETGTVSFTGTTDISVDVSLTTTVDQSKTIVFYSVSSDTTADDAEEHIVRASLNSAGDTLTFSRSDGNSTSSATPTIRYYVAEFSAGVTVQWITSTSRNANVSITSVATARTALLLGFEANGTFASSGQRTCHAAELVDATNIKVNVNATNLSVTWTCQVIEFDSDSGVSVESAQIELNGVLTNTATIGTVTTANSTIFSGCVSDDNATNGDEWGHACTLTNSTTIEAERASSGGVITVYAFVIDWGSNVEVRTGQEAAMGTGVATQSISFSAITNTANAVGFANGQPAQYVNKIGLQDNYAATLVRPSIDSTTGGTLTRELSDRSSEQTQWWVVDFSGFAGGGGTTGLSVNLAGSGGLAGKGGLAGIGGGLAG